VADAQRRLLGRRFSELTTIDSRNVASLSLGWTHRIAAAGPAGGGGTTAAVIKGTPVVVNGVLYVTIPDHVWALDARSGRELWHASWPSKGGWHIGNRGVAVLGTSVYVSTPDCHLLALDNRTGKEKWRTEICDLDQFYYASAAPLIVRNHVIVGVSGDDLDIPGYIESHDPETGARQWRWYTHPEPGTPEAKTWPSVEAMLHGGGMTWGSTTYDPQLNLIYFGTGNRSR
jgi:alcohol dehydrogenase (cytochrome c)